MSICNACGAPANTSTAGCPECARPLEGTRAEGGALVARHALPNYDAEGLPDARHDEFGAIHNTGKVRALKPGANTPLPGTHRPPVLASEVLREDLRPLAPGTTFARRVGVVCGLACVGLGLAGLEGSLGAAVVMAIGVAMAGAGFLPVSYALRATLSFALGASLVAGSSVATLLVTPGGRAFLALPVVVLATGLFFRSWHRASLHARWVVALGVVLSAGWLGWSDNMDAIGGATHWQAWLPAVARLALAPVLLAALLAFMGEATTGGCSAWAVSALAWHGLLMIVEGVAATWPTSGGLQSVDALRFAVSAAQGLSAIGAPVLAVAGAQLMVVATSNAATSHPAQATQRPA